MTIYDAFNNLINSYRTVFRPDWISIDTESNEVIVNEITTQSISAYAAGVNAISNSIASIPFKLMLDKEVIKDDLYYLIKEKPNKFMGSFDFFRQMLHTMLYRGTAFAIIRRDSNGFVEEILPLKFESVTEARMLEGELYYIIENLPYHTDDVLVFKISGIGAFGIDPISAFAETLGITLSSTRYAKKSFEGDGSNIKGVITSDHKLKDEQKKSLRDSINKNYTGSNSKSLLVLDHGFKFDPVSLNPEQLKLIETRSIQVAEIARILNVPIYIIASELGGSYNSIETMSLDFYKRSLSPIIFMIEQELRHKLLTKKQIMSDYKFKGAIESLLRGDSASRASFYKELFYLGAISPEEIRELEDMPQDIIGETYVQANLMPKTLVNEYYDSKIQETYSKVDKNKNNI